MQCVVCVVYTVQCAVYCLPRMKQERVETGYVELNVTLENYLTKPIALVSFFKTG